jgi:hypothetical protein
MRHFAVLSGLLVVLLLATACDGERAAAPAPVPAKEPEAPMLRGVVIDIEGRPLAGTLVRAVIPFGAGQRARQEGLSATSGPDGSFALDLVAAFDPAQEVPVVLLANRDGCLPFRQTLRVFRRTTGMSVDIRLFPAGRVAGRVADPSGAPISRAEVFVVGAEQIGFARIDSGFFAVSGEDGRFEIPAVPLGTMDLGVHASDFIPEVVGPIEITAGLTTEAGDVRLRPGRAISGSVRTPQDEPVPGAFVRAFRKRELRQFAYFGRLSVAEAGGQTVTDATGAFRIGGLADGAYTVEVEAPGYLTVDAAARDVSPGGAPVPLLLSADTWIELTVVDGATGAPIPRYDLLMALAVGEGFSRREEVLGGGTHRLPLNRGEKYRLEISSEGYDVSSRPISIETPGGTPLRIPLVPR